MGAQSPASTSSFLFIAMADGCGARDDFGEERVVEGGAEFRLGKERLIYLYCRI